MFSPKYFEDTVPDYLGTHVEGIRKCWAFEERI